MDNTRKRVTRFFQGRIAVDEQTGSKEMHRVAATRLDHGGVALCFKVPFRFRQWFKLQALSRNLTMTEFLIKAAESYSLAEHGATGANAEIQK
jgi:hypothetical protein